MFSLLSWLLVDTSNHTHHHAFDCQICCQAKFLTYICNVQKKVMPVSLNILTLVQQGVPWEQSDSGRQEAIPVLRLGGARVSL